MGFEHSSGAGTGRSLKSNTNTTTTTSGPTVDGTGHAHNHHLMHIGPFGSLFIFRAFASPTGSTSTGGITTDAFFMGLVN